MSWETKWNEILEKNKIGFLEECFKALTNIDQDSYLLMYNDNSVVASDHIDQESIDDGSAILIKHFLKEDKINLIHNFGIENMIIAINDYVKEIYFEFMERKK